MHPGLTAWPDNLTTPGCPGELWTPLLCSEDRPFPIVESVVTKKAHPWAGSRMAHVALACCLTLFPVTLPWLILFQSSTQVLLFLQHTRLFFISWSWQLFFPLAGSFFLLTVGWWLLSLFSSKLKALLHLPYIFPHSRYSQSELPDGFPHCTDITCLFAEGLPHSAGPCALWGKRSSLCHRSLSEGSASHGSS
jgi:hypothetical protein